MREVRCRVSPGSRIRYNVFVLFVCEFVLEVGDVLENVAGLIEAAEKEVADVTTASEALAAARSQLQDAQTAVTGAQTTVDNAQAALASEKTEAVVALRAIVDEVNAAIETLQAVPA